MRRVALRPRADKDPTRLEHWPLAEGSHAQSRGEITLYTTNTDAHFSQENLQTPTTHIITRAYMPDRCTVGYVGPVTSTPPWMQGYHIYTLHSLKLEGMVSQLHGTIPGVDWIGVEWSGLIPVVGATPIGVELWGPA